MFAHVDSRLHLVGQIELPGVEVGIAHRPAQTLYGVFEKLLGSAKNLCHCEAFLSANKAD